MQFRPCIDIHNGKVKQIVGGSIRDEKNYARENFVAETGAGYYAELFRKNNLKGGHIILLNKAGTEYYEADLAQAKEALRVWPGAFQIGGGVNAENAAQFIQMGASHVVVTSYVFVEGEIRFDRLEKLVQEVGKEHLVLDLSCRKKDGRYFVVTDRWQKFTRHSLDDRLLDMLRSYSDEFLVHAVNVEGTGTGVDQDLLAILAGTADICVTYAGGIGKMQDIETIHTIGGGRIDFTVGSALDLYGGTISFEEIVKKYGKV